MKTLAPILIVAAGAAIFLILLATRPPAEAGPPSATAPLVRVTELRPTDLRMGVLTQGTVAPRTESNLIPEVEGRVVSVSASLVSGGFFAEGDELLRIDTHDYRVALERARANLARTAGEHRRARRELERQKGLAEREYASPSQLDTAETAELVARASQREAQASLAKAERDLDRTTIRAPYSGRVREESVDVGQFVKRGDPIAKLYATDYAEVRLPIPDKDLAYLDLSLSFREQPGAVGPEVRLTAEFAGASHSWMARVVRTEGEIDARSRMVHVIARVDDPYASREGDRRPPLAVGLFVEAEIQGRRENDVRVVPRAAVRGKKLLVVDADDRLRLRDAEILRSGREEVVLRSGPLPGDRAVLSTPEVVVDGMTVRVKVVNPPRDRTRAWHILPANPLAGARPGTASGS